MLQCTRKEIGHAPHAKKMASPQSCSRAKTSASSAASSEKQPLMQRWTIVVESRELSSHRPPWTPPLHTRYKEHDWSIHRNFHVYCLLATPLCIGFNSIMDDFASRDVARVMICLCGEMICFACVCTSLNLSDGAGSIHVRSALPFSHLVRVFEAPTAPETRKSLTYVIDQYHANLKKAEDAREKRGEPRRSEKDSFFPIMRLLLPHLDRSRSSYNLKEVSTLLIEHSMPWCHPSSLTRACHHSPPPPHQSSFTTTMLC